MNNRMAPTRVETLAATHSVSSVSCGAFHIAIIATEVVDNSTVNSSDVQVDMMGGDEDVLKMERMDSEVFRYTYSSNRDGGANSSRVVLMTW